ncbi:hypothetical protein C8J56DRAFT_81081 [Mycena floridula]|nr:hypothetical protein C8J56DRAFT_81081 [Mycena floridula]
MAYHLLQWHYHSMWKVFLWVSWLNASSLADLYLHAGNISAPMMSNNHIDISNYYQSQANFEDSDFAVLRAGDIYLTEEVSSSKDKNDILETRYKGRITSVTSEMSIWCYHGERAAKEFERACQVYESMPRYMVFAALNTSEL